MSKKLFIVMIVILGVALIIVGYLIAVQYKPKEATTEANTVSATTNEIDRFKYSTSEPESIWVFVNKDYSIPKDYKPKLVKPSVATQYSPSSEQMQVSKVVKEPLESMFAAAKKDGANLVLGSAFRSYNLQAKIYSNSVASQGEEATEHYSAKPGHSEHQTGLAVDVATKNGNCFIEPCWAKTTESKWVAENAHKYGFIIRYPKGKTDITGYAYEPWHLRYVGTELASYLNENSLTLEEFFLPENY